MYGSGKEDSGMIEEYNISKLDKNRIIIPIGSTWLLYISQSPRDGLLSRMPYYD